MRSISPVCSSTISHLRGIRLAVYHLVRIEHVYRSPRAGPSPLPQFNPWVLFPNIEVEDVVITGTVIY